MSIQFNWYELNYTTRIPDAQVILLFCLYINKYKPLARRIASNHIMLQNKLHIRKNYYTIIYKNCIIEHRNGIFSNYTCIEPQSYLFNCSFLHARVPAQTKSEYMYILSQRSLNNRNNWIPEDYVEEKYWNNPFIEHKQSKLIFKLEINKHDNKSNGTRLDAVKKATKREW
jgi:hypothetical protein